MENFSSPNIDNLNNVLTFELQPIVHAADHKIVGYEFLLRSKKNNRFPTKEFNLLTQNNENNLIFMKWLQQKLLSELKNKPTKTISFNLNPQH